MQQHLYKYLLLNQKLSIPALGNFVIEYQPAYFNEATGLLFPRRPVIEFNEGPAAEPEKPFFDFLAVEMGVDVIVAIKAFQDFSIYLLAGIAGNQFADIDGIGKVKKGANGRIFFLPDTNLIDILPPLRLGEKIKMTRPASSVKVVPEVKEIKEVRPIAEVRTVQVPEPEEIKQIKTVEEPQPMLPIRKEPDVEEIKEAKILVASEVPAQVAKEVKPIPAVKTVPEPLRVVRPSLVDPELERLAAEVEKIKKANELKALSEKEKAAAKVIEMKAARPFWIRLVNDNWWFYPAALAIIGLVALLIKVL